MHSKSDNIKFRSYNYASQTVDDLFESLRSRYQGNLETSMEESEFVLDSAQLMHYQCRKVNFRRVGWYVDSPDWIKTKKATINPKYKDNKYFQYAVTVALNYEEIKWNPERVSNIKPFINKQEYLSKTDDWKTFEKNNSTIALDIFYIKGKQICSGYI